MRNLPDDLSATRTLEFVDELIEGCRLEPLFVPLIPRLAQVRGQLLCAIEARLRARSGCKGPRRRLARATFELREAAQAISVAANRRTDPDRRAGVQLALFPEGFTPEIVRATSKRLLDRATSVLAQLAQGIPFLSPLDPPVLGRFEAQHAKLRAALAARDEAAAVLRRAEVQERRVADDAAHEVHRARDAMRELCKGDLARARAAYPDAPLGGADPDEGRVAKDPAA